MLALYYENVLRFFRSIPNIQESKFHPNEFTLNATKILIEFDRKVLSVSVEKNENESSFPLYIGESDNVIWMKLKSAVKTL